MSDLTAHSIVIEDIKDWRGQDVIDTSTSAWSTARWATARAALAKH